MTFAALHTNEPDRLVMRLADTFESARPVTAGCLVGQALGLRGALSPALTGASGSLAEAAMSKAWRQPHSRDVQREGRGWRRVSLAALGRLRGALFGGPA
jgi:hypothetical protein